MRVLITGGAGFIGSHLAERCLQEGWKVSVLDDLSTGSLENILHLKDCAEFNFTLGSVLDRPLLTELLEGCDLVFHLAAAVGVRLIVDNPVRTIETNVNGTAVLLAAAARNQIPLIIASTSEVYGKSTAIPFREDADLVLGATTKARWSYAASKALDEFLGIAYWTHSGLPVTIIRLFNTVGPRQTGRYGMVLPSFVRQAVRGEPITVYGSGAQRRCFSYVGDVVKAILRLAQTPGIAGEVVNIGNNEEITIRDLAHLVKEIADSTSPIVHMSYEEAYGVGFEDMARRVPCLEKLERLTGDRPQTPIRTIIRTVVEHERMQPRPWGIFACHQVSKAAAATEA